jgi:hypothetical protein
MTGNVALKVAVVGIWIAGAAAAQPGDSAPPEPAAVKTHHAAEDDSSEPTAIFRAPLIREGSAITDAVAHIQRDPDRGWWKLIIDQNDANLPQQELFLLQCTQLSQMQHIVEASDRTVKFQLSGQVFVFRGRNYVLPTYAPVLAQSEARDSASPDDSSTQAPQPGAPPPVPDQQPPANQPTDSEQSKTSPSQDSQRAADIMRDLERGTGPMPRHPSAAQHQNEPGARPRAASDANENKKLLPEETPLVSRRGKITRDASGGWMFVFDSDASGLADPPMRLLPCLLLERIEDYARRTGNNSPALLSGPVYLYESQNYLLPTVFRIPQERRNITP